MFIVPSRFVEIELMLLAQTGFIIYLWKAEEIEYI